MRLRREIPVSVNLAKKWLKKTDFLKILPGRDMLGECLSEPAYQVRLIMKA